MSNLDVVLGLLAQIPTVTSVGTEPLTPEKEAEVGGPGVCIYCIFTTNDGDPTGKAGYFLPAKVYDELENNQALVDNMTTLIADINANKNLYTPYNP